MIEYIEAALPSQPEVTVTLPKECDASAREYIKRAIENPQGLVDYLREHPDEFTFSDNIDVSNKTGLLMQAGDTPLSKKLQDALYLRIAIRVNSAYTKSEDPKEQEKALEVEDKLIELVREIESPEE